MKRIVALLLFTFTGYASALNITGVTSVNVTVTYKEPSTNADGSPLEDLVGTNVYYQIGTVVTKAIEVPATSPNGGGDITTEITVPVSDGEDKDVTVWATALDDGTPQNESEPSPFDTVNIDRQAPGAPL